jgi:YfiH family protein
LFRHVFNQLRALSFLYRAKVAKKYHNTKNGVHFLVEITASLRFFDPARLQYLNFSRKFAKKICFSIMQQHLNKLTPYHTFSVLDRYRDELLHFSSTRHGGVSSGRNGTLNLGFHDDDAPENVVRNRSLLAQSVGFDPQAIAVANQVHGDSVAVVTPDMRGSGATGKATAIADADALICSVPNICIAVKTADCAPILIYDVRKKAIAAIHAGWRGTVQQLARIAVEKMQAEFGCTPRDMAVAIGSAIGRCCYEVGNDVVSSVQQSAGSVEGLIYLSPVTGKPHFDMREFSYRMLVKSGVQPQNIEVSPLCARCCKHELFSHRNGHSGRMLTGIMMVKS